MNSFASASHADSTALPVSRLGTPTEDLYPRLFDAIAMGRLAGASSQLPHNRPAPGAETGK